MRGDLVSRPVGDVLKGAKALFEGGVKELLVISQDTSAYGVDVKYRTGFWDGKPVKTRMLELGADPGRDCRALWRLGASALRIPVPSVDEVIPLMATGRVLPYLDVPFQHSHPDVLKAHEAPASGERNLSASSAGAKPAPDRDPQHFHCRLPGENGRVPAPADFVREAQIDRCGLLCLRAT